MNLYSQIKEILTQSNIPCIGSWNNRDFYSRNELHLLEHNGDFYWDKKGPECCYDYPIESCDELKQIIKCYDKLDYCTTNPKDVALDEYLKCVSEIKQLRKNWNLKNA